MSGGSWTVFEAFRIADLNVPQFRFEYLQRLKIVVQHESDITSNLFIFPAVVGKF